MNARRIAVSTLLATMSATPSAFAEEGKDQVSVVDGTLEGTKVSGWAGATHKELSSVTDGALKGLVVTELSDKPFKITLEFGFLPGQTGNPADRVIELPGAGLGTSTAKSVRFTGESLFVRGVKVCTTDDNHRIKGVKIYSAKVNGDATIEKGNPEQEFSLNNCKTWHNAVFCPDDKVAVGVIAHSSDKGFTGLALRCQALRFKKSGTIYRN